MKRGESQVKRAEILKEIKRLAKGKVNDAVRLAYLSEDELAEIGKLELSAVAEFKRNSNGTVELKFVDRLSALTWLAEQAEDDPRGKALYEALEKGTEKET
ncbi:MAG: XRE family transcriptional regulator [Oscillospiraceae bacterium]|nr:XRE family transcriptional regulator [Oscillospiraceae bacterium]